MDFNSGAKFHGNFLISAFLGAGLSYEAGSHLTCSSNAKMCHVHVPMHMDSSETSWVSNYEACLLLELPACVCVASLLSLPLQENNTFQRLALWLQPDSAPRELGEHGALWFRLK